MVNRAVSAYPIAIANDDLPSQTKILVAKSLWGVLLRDSCLLAQTSE